jgi:hypothetical protein
LVRDHLLEDGKRCFFEKKHQKTFDTLGFGVFNARSLGPKIFCAACFQKSGLLSEPA